MSGSRGYRQVEGKRGDHENNHLFVRRVLGQVRLYRERTQGCVGGGKTDKDEEIDIVDEELQYHRRGPQYNWWGCRLLP